MDYGAAFAYPFRSPRWAVNLILGGVCMLIPMIGPIVYLGYLGDCLDRLLKDPRPGPPDLDFNRFGAYVQRGLWPFLAMLVVGLVGLPLGLFAYSPLLAIPAFDLKPPLAVLPIVAVVLLGLLYGVALTLATIPSGIRAMMDESIGPALSPRFLLDFVDRTGPEMVMAMLVLYAAAIPLVIVGYACCLVGVYPAMALLMSIQWHLNYQLYGVYLRRGGPPFATSKDADDWE